MRVILIYILIYFFIMAKGVKSIYASERKWYLFNSDAYIFRLSEDTGTFLAPWLSEYKCFTQPLISLKFRIPQLTYDKVLVTHTVLNSRLRIFFLCRGFNYNDIQLAKIFRLVSDQPGFFHALACNNSSIIDAMHQLPKRFDIRSIYAEAPIDNAEMYQRFNSFDGQLFLDNDIVF
jgi:hypothetical protein